MITSLPGGGGGGGACRRKGNGLKLAWKKIPLSLMGTLQDDINLMGIFEKCRGVCETETHQVLKWWKTLMEMCAHVGVGGTPQPKHCYVWIQSTLAALNIATVGYLCLIFHLHRDYL